MFVDAAETLAIELKRRALWKDLHANLAPLPPTSPHCRWCTRGLHNHLWQRHGQRQLLETYLGWPGYNEALTTDTTLQQILKSTLDALPQF